MIEYLPGVSETTGSIPTAIKNNNKPINQPQLPPTHPPHPTPQKKGIRNRQLGKKILEKERLHALRIIMSYEIHQRNTKQEMEMI